jgi:hypothetical protein
VSRASLACRSSSSWKVWIARAPCRKGPANNVGPARYWVREGRVSYSRIADHTALGGEILRHRLGRIALQHLFPKPSSLRATGTFPHSQAGSAKPRSAPLSGPSSGWAGSRLSPRPPRGKPARQGRDQHTDQQKGQSLDQQPLKKSPCGVDPGQHGDDSLTSTALRSPCLSKAHHRRERFSFCPIGASHVAGAAPF